MTRLSGEAELKTWIGRLGSEKHFPLSVSVLGHLLSRFLYPDHTSTVSFIVYEDGEDFLVVSRVRSEGSEQVKVGLYLGLESGKDVKSVRSKLLNEALSPFLKETGGSYRRMRLESC